MASIDSSLDRVSTVSSVTKYSIRKSDEYFLEGGDPEKREGKGRTAHQKKRRGAAEPITMDVFKKSAEMKTHDERDACCLPSVLRGLLA